MPNTDDLILDYGAVFSTDAGKRVLADLEACLSERQSFVVGKPDLTAFNEGERSVVLRMRHLIAKAGEIMAARMKGHPSYNTHAVLYEDEGGEA